MGQSMSAASTASPDRCRSADAAVLGVDSDSPCRSWSSVLKHSPAGHLLVASSSCGGASAGSVSAASSSCTAAVSCATAAATAAAGKRRERKKIGGLATLRRRLVLRRRPHKQQDHAKVIREHIGAWSADDVCALRDEYAALAVRRLVCARAAAARPRARSCRHDLCRLYVQRVCADVELVYQGRVFAVHRSILSARCPHFRRLLKECPRTVDGRVPVHMCTPGVDAALFDALLQYLYCGQMDGCPSTDGDGGAWRRQLMQLEAEFGEPAPLERDMKRLLETADLADALLVFRSPQQAAVSTGDASTDASAAAMTASGATPHHHHHHYHHPHQQQQQQQQNLSTAFGCLSTSSDALTSTSSSAAAAAAAYSCRTAAGAAVTSSLPFELPCHKAVLCARSPFFRSFIERRQKACVDSTDSGGGGGGGVRRSLVGKTTPIRIELDESVIPRRYAYVLLRAMYLDCVDLALIIPECPTSAPTETSSSAAAPAAAAAVSGVVDTVTDAMELYQIGRFVELDSLTHACEDLIVDALCVDNVAGVLHWASQPHGSRWVYRQAVQFVCDEFGAVCGGGGAALLRLSESQLDDVISSDFLQASELEVLQAIITWSEHHLAKLVEQREPNLLSHTAHSVARKGVRRRELNDTELRALMAHLLMHLRVSQLLPVTHDTVTSAIRRGLISIPPSHMITEDSSSRAGSWLRCKWRREASCAGPRYFLPYVEEVKARASALEWQMGGSSGGGGGADNTAILHSRDVPDTLYMLRHSDIFADCGAQPGECVSCQVGDSLSDDTTAAAAASGATSSAEHASSGETLVSLRDDVVYAMLRRRCQLLRAGGVYWRALQCRLLSPTDTVRQVALHVVREFALPDCMALQLQEASFRLETQQQRRLQHQQQQQQNAIMTRWRSASDLGHVTVGVSPLVSTPHRHTDHGMPAESEAVAGLYNTYSGRGAALSVLLSGGNNETDSAAGGNTVSGNVSLPTPAGITTVPDVALSSSTALAVGGTTPHRPSSRGRHLHHHRSRNQQQQQQERRHASSDRCLEHTARANHRHNRHSVSVGAHSEERMTATAAAVGDGTAVTARQHAARAAVVAVHGRQPDLVDARRFSPQQRQSRRTGGVYDALARQQTPHQ